MNTVYSDGTAADRISSMLSPGSTTPFVWSYDADTGRKSGLAYPNGVSAQWSYDARGNLVQVRNGTTGQVVSLFGYTWISEIAGNAEMPSFDLDGNQTLVTTKTGTWTVSYNGENRPVLWSNGVTNIVMAYDSMGRRVSCDTCVGNSIRWLIRDPIMELGGIGLYGYLGNNAGGFNDSLGLKLLPRRDPRYEKSKQIKGTPKYQLFVSHFDVDLYEKAFRNFKNTLDKVISKLEECCSKEGLKGDKICDAILSNEEIPIYLKMYVRTQQFTVKYSNACGGGGPYIEYIEGYDMKSGELRPPFPYLGEDGREYR